MRRPSAFRALLLPLVLGACVPPVPEPARVADECAPGRTRTRAGVSAIGGAGGTVSGVVRDGRHGRPVAGVAVEVDGHHRAAYSDTAGAFAFGALRSGPHVLAVARDGYAARLIGEVSVTADSGARLDVALTPVPPASDCVQVDALTDDFMVVNAVDDGTGPAPFTLRDHEAAARALPPWVPGPGAALGEAPPRALAHYPAALRLPAGAVEDDEVPAGPIQEWDWADGTTLLLTTWPNPQLPGLHSMPARRPGVHRLTIAGRPMAVLTRGPDADSREHRAWVEGYLDDRTDFSAHVAAPTAARRDALLLHLATLARTDATR